MTAFATPDRAARRMYEGAGLGPKDVNIFNPYDGYAPMAQFLLEAFQWHGVKRVDAFAFYAGLPPWMFDGEALVGPG